MIVLEIENLTTNNTFYFLSIHIKVHTLKYVGGVE